MLAYMLLCLPATVVLPACSVSRRSVYCPTLYGSAGSLFSVAVGSLVCIVGAHTVLRHAVGTLRLSIIQQQTTASNPSPPGTSTLQYTSILHYAPLVGIGSGQGQLIGVPCIAEHA